MNPNTSPLRQAALLVCVVATVTFGLAACKFAAAAFTASPMAALAVDVPYTRFVLSNGLTVIVHEDHKAPVVAVNLWYHVGSKNEPRGKWGFAHLFEHLMFNGSENFNDDWFKATSVLGASDMNGTTNADRTNYFETVPKNALDSVLWLESDRMGHFLGAVDQGKLDEQRGVVLNEKLQGENQPYGQVGELIARATYPSEHPYSHSTIGSAADLNAASLEDVREWFRAWYGASNAVLVLSGDITVAEAREKAQKYFGDISPGMPVSQPLAWTAKRSGTQREITHDQVGQPRLYRVWNVPAARDADTDYLDILGGVLAGDKTSRLYRRLVHVDRLATEVSAGDQSGEIAGQFMVAVTAKPGIDLARIERIVDEELRKLIATGPTAAELERVRNGTISGFVRNLENVGGSGKSDLLASSEVLYGSPDGWKAGFERMKSATPKQVAEVGKRWLSDGDYILHVLPFGDHAAAASGADRSKMPEPSAAIAPVFPRVQRATLSNGLSVVLAERHDVPVVNMRLMIRTGIASDYAAEKPGVGSLAMDLLDEGAGSRTGLQIAETLGDLGAQLGTSGGKEVSNVSLSTLTPTLDPALGVFADVVLRPTFKQTDVERLKEQYVAGLESGKRNPSVLAGRLIPTMVYGADHPYGRPVTEATVRSLMRGDMTAFHERWFKPNNATLIVVGDIGLTQLLPKLENVFGAWKPGAVPNRLKPDARPAQPRLYLVDKPGAPQSVIIAALPAPAREPAGDEVVEVMNNIVGGSFLSRLNMNLREDKHWSYGVRSGLFNALGSRLFRIQAPVQTDRTAESIAEIRRELANLSSSQPINDTELANTRKELTLGLSSAWSTGDGVAGYLADITANDLRDDFYANYSQRLGEVTTAQANAAAKAIVDGDALTWMIVGDRTKIEGSLRKLGIGELRVIDADGNDMP